MLNTLNKSEYDINSDKLSNINTFDNNILKERILITPDI